MSTSWPILTATLPPQPSGLRVRVWRALKATGAGTLREGVYILPPECAPNAKTLYELERTIAGVGAGAHLLVAMARDDAQERSTRALFDRVDQYREFLKSVKEAHDRIRESSETELHKAMRSLEAQLQALRSSDFFPGRNGEKAASALAALRREVDLHLAQNEPASTADAIPPRAIADYQGRTWATRKRPWVDRLGTAWLIRRFIDRTPTFVWLADPKRCPKSALGYDFDHATFTRVGEKVTFEVVAQSFGLLEDPALRRLATLIHTIDVGGIPVDEAPGLELLVRGLQALHADDDALLTAATPAFDACYAAIQVPHER